MNKQKSESKEVAINSRPGEIRETHSRGQIFEGCAKI